MQKQVVVLGAGMVGRCIALDLASVAQVRVADLSSENLAKLRNFSEGKKIETCQADLSQAQELQRVVADCDVVVGAVPGFMGYQTLKQVVEMGKNIVDISFFSQDPFALDQLAKEKGVTAVIDCGVAPGMGNIIVGYHSQSIEINSFVCLVGGLPKIRIAPYEYKAPFSPIDVIEEYTRPVRIVQDGKMVVKPPLSGLETFDFPEIGTLEAFYTDGLRTLLHTMNIPNMEEKTLRYPGHIERIRLLDTTGFFQEEPVEIKGQKVRPVDLASKLLFSHWQLGEHEPEFTLMQIVLDGTQAEEGKRYRYHLLDQYDSATQMSSMARTTSYTCTAVTNLLLQQKWHSPGICPPEYIGKDEQCFQFIMKYLRDRGVIYRCEEETYQLEEQK